MYIRKRFNCIKSKSLINNCGKNGNIYFVRIYLFINVKKKKRKVITVFSLLSSLILFIRWFLPTFKVFKYWSVLYYVYKRTFYSILICFVSKKQRCSEPFIYNAVESSPLPPPPHSSFYYFNCQLFLTSNEIIHKQDSQTRFALYTGKLNIILLSLTGIK